MGEAGMNEVWVDGTVQRGSIACQPSQYRQYIQRLALLAAVATGYAGAKGARN